MESQVKIWTIVGLIVFGFILGIGSSYLKFNSKINELHHYGDSVSVVARNDSTIAKKLSDSVKVVIAKLDTAQAHSLQVAADADKRVKAFHDQLHQEVAANAKASALLDSLEAAHQVEVDTLKNAVVLANSKYAVEKFRGDTLESLVYKLNGTVQALHVQIDKLNAPPSLVLKIGTWVERGFAVKGFVDTVRGK